MITERQYARDATPNDISELIATRQHELNDLEFKVSADADLLKAACGIANAGGGFILIGVTEDADHCAAGVSNIENVNSVCDSVRQRLRDGLAPRPVIEVVPLRVSECDIVVVRISPQNPPHMVSFEKKTDFWGRYDATTERMRYEEIEQRFREKNESGVVTMTETPTRVIETITGRTSISEGAVGALETYISQLRVWQQPCLGLIAVSDANQGAISEEDARNIFEHPLYERRGGWTVVHPTLEVTRSGGAWIQRYGTASVTTVNPSGDAVFIKAIDDVLCWRQDEAAFRQSPRLYPNALVEYCLSFAYFIADITARTHPRQLLVKAVMSKGEGSHLPLGEGGSVWFDAPLQPPHGLTRDFVESLAIHVDATQLIIPRRLAFKIAAEVYAFYEYSEDNVAFSSDDEILQESDRDVATLTSIRTYLQELLLVPVEEPYEDHARDTFWFWVSYFGRRFRIGATEEFLDDHYGTEGRLFADLDAMGLRPLVDDLTGTQSLVLRTDGPRIV